MFVCDPCLEERFTNSPGLFRSVGMCECCNTRKECSDIPSKYLNLRPTGKQMKAYSLTGVIPKQ